MQQSHARRRRRFATDAVPAEASRIMDHGILQSVPLSYAIMFSLLQVLNDKAHVSGGHVGDLRRSHQAPGCV
eukprot:4901944-Amphidinium_carterae.1